MFGSFRVWIAVPRTMPHHHALPTRTGNVRPPRKQPPTCEREQQPWDRNILPRVWMLSRVREEERRNCWNFAVDAIIRKNNFRSHGWYLFSNRLGVSSSRFIGKWFRETDRIRKNDARTWSWKLEDFLYSFRIRMSKGKYACFGFYKNWRLWYFQY